MVPLSAAFCDLIYTILQGRKESVAQFQYVSPVVIITSMVSGVLMVNVTTVSHQSLMHG